jgi:uncharacterized protein YndB with AHSA1/START domain
LSSTRIHRRINAPRSVVYRALLDARAVATWMAPTGMTSRVHTFDAREETRRLQPLADRPTDHAVAHPAVQEGS